MKKQNRLKIRFKMDKKTLSYFTNKKIVITGGSGYLAASVISLLKDIECSIIRLDRVKPENFNEKTNAKITDVTTDITDGRIWKKVIQGTDIIFHFAAQTSTYFANKNPIEDIKINVTPMVNMLETCRKNNFKPVIIFSGTVTEAGMPVKLPVNEKNADSPITVYDVHKLMAEKYLMCYSALNIVKGVVLRLSNVYGPGPASSSADRGILNMMVRRALKGEDITLYGKGEFIRDYIFVQDVAKAFILAATNINNTNAKYYIIGSGKGYRIAEAFNMVARKVATRIGKEVKVVNVKPPSISSTIENRNFIADYSAFKDATGWKTKYSLSEGIDQTIEFFLKHNN